MTDRIPLTEEQIDEIAEKAAQKALGKMTNLMYQEIGKTVASKFFLIIGTLAVAVVGTYQAVTHFTK
jgi:hypothetical protein